LKQEFLKFISILLGQEPGHFVADNQEPLHRLGQRFNELLNIKNVEERLHTELTYEGKTYLIPPVPFASTNEQNQPLSFAFLGLNPKLFLDNDTTIREKLYAGETWDQYAASYTTIKRKDRDIGNFYQNLMMLMQSLKKKELVMWSEFVKDRKTPAEKLDLFNLSLEEDPLFVGEFVPFHSSKMGSYDKKTVQRLMEEIPEYKAYLTGMFNLIFNKLDANGWLITNGKASSEALEMFIEENLLGGQFTKMLDKCEDGYTCYVWEHDGTCRKVLLLHEFLRRANGKLNHSDDLASMVDNVVNAFEQWEKPLDYESIEGHQVEGETTFEVEDNEEMPVEPQLEEVNRYSGFGEYAAIAERIDRFILEGMGSSQPVYQMVNIAEGESYSEKPRRKLGGFAKLGYAGEPFLLLRFGTKAAGGHLGLVRQFEIDRLLGHLNERPISNIKKHPNETFILLKLLAEHDDQETWKLVEEKIVEAYGEYYCLRD